MYGLYRANLGQRDDATFTVTQVSLDRHDRHDVRVRLAVDGLSNYPLILLHGTRSPHKPPLPMTSDRLKGLVITAAGVLALTPDSLLIRLILADPMTLLFYRGVLLWASLTAGIALFSRERLLPAYRAIGRTGALAAVLLAASTLCFVLAVKHTLVANVLVIVGAAPLFAAVFGRVFLAERTPARTWVAVFAALAGIAVTVSGSLGRGRLAGDLCALGTACFISGQLTALRRTPRVDMTPSVALGGLFAAVIALPFAAPLSVSTHDIGYLLLLGVLVLPVSFALIAAGPRYLPAPEVCLIMLVEMVLGPIWVWLVLSEHPGSRALAGGSVVLLAVAIHALVGLKRGEPDPRTPPRDPAAIPIDESGRDFSP